MPYGKFFSLPVLNRACSKMKSAQLGFSFKKSIQTLIKKIQQYKVENKKIKNKRTKNTNYKVSHIYKSS